MSKSYLTALLFALISVFGCTKEEADFRVPEFEIPVIHGYFARDINGNGMGAFGYAKPNVNLGDKSSLHDSNYYIIAFPNPMHDFLNVITKSPDENEVKKLWITRAILRPPFDNGTVLTDSWNNFVAGGSPLLQVEFTQKNVFLDLTELANGYYRVYLKVNDLLLYDNLVIDREFSPYR
jgi:hypothetical protein